MRLDRYLCEAGIGTRSQVKKIIAKGQVSVNETSCSDPGRHVDPETDCVRVNGAVLSYREHVYFLLHKPQNVLSASRADLRNPAERCVIDLIAEEKHRDLFPVGRLDKDTEGLLLITDDGALAHDLLSPGKHVDKCYYARLRDPLSETDRQKLEQGVSIGDDTPTLPCTVDPVTDSSIRITIHEGRYHQIKRMLEAVNNQVLYLKRLSMGPLTLDPALAPGEYRPLTPQELAALKNNAKTAD